MQSIEWAAGILEGEGTFSMFKRRNKYSYQCSIFCEMTDADTIISLQKILGVGRISHRKARLNRKPTSVLAIQKKCEVFDTLIKVLPFLQARRLEKAKQLFNYLESSCT